ncbi:hypothetical protein [Clostridium brassicae]|uniref:Uncharacterized protein n=1 Tax=Clostridium brassicae TaxID=2999072 RepID=A0ABT4D9Z8_9CLOT|nr:hypothetical protein [Clostridium brassicae]MCY6959139.1 hypothetical protein [Clostridium brassicae]
MRGEHIYVQEDESIKVIDPRKSFTKEVLIPYGIIKVVDKTGELDKFVKVLVIYRPDLAISWMKAINR